MPVFSPVRARRATNGSQCQRSKKGFINKQEILDIAIMTVKYGGDLTKTSIYEFSGSMRVYCINKLYRFSPSSVDKARLVGKTDSSHQVYRNNWTGGFQYQFVLLLVGVRTPDKGSLDSKLYTPTSD